MHGDEAVNAFKLGELLEENRFEYDPREYHGPTLYYLTGLASRLRGVETYAALDEQGLRGVSALLGMLLVLGLILARPVLGTGATAVAAFGTALSPAMVFYSRYFIHEMLLVAATFGVFLCGYRYCQGEVRKLRWLVPAGFFLGLMAATKETFVLSCGAMAGAVLLVWWAERRQARSPDSKARWLGSHWLVVGAVAAVTCGLFYSSFLSRPSGLMDFVLSYVHYLDRADGDTIHQQPWHYYFGLLTGYRFADGPVFTEAILVILAGVGTVAAVWGSEVRGGGGGADRRFMRFLAAYTWILAAMYSMIPYKTPWCLLGFLHGMILLAGYGTMVSVRWVRGRFRFLLVAGLLAGGIHLGWQAWAGSFVYHADSRNPYVYAHPTPDVFLVADRVEAMASAHELGREMPIEVIAPGGDYWPLPWYLRGYRAAFRSEVNQDPDQPLAPVIVIKPEVEPDLVHRFYEVPPPGQKHLYMYLFYRNGAVETVELRPRVELRGFVRKDLLDRYEALQSGDGAAADGMMRRRPGNKDSKGLEP